MALVNAKFGSYPFDIVIPAFINVAVFVSRTEPAPASIKDTKPE